MSKKILTFEEYKLDELFASDLIEVVEPKRSERSKRIEVIYDGIRQRTAKSKTKTILFHANDPEGSGKSWTVEVKIPDYKDISRLKKQISTKEKVELALEAGDILIDCNCPDFLYKGYKYMGSQFGYSSKDEDREPIVRNPDLVGSLCKHATAVLTNMNKYLGDISDDISSYHKKK